MKHSRCPKCDSNDLGDRWQNKRMLRQHCNECGWNGNDRVPEQEEIKTTRVVSVGQFGGFEYTMFDRYGHVMVYSRAYNTEAAAEAALAIDMKRSATDEHAGPYTAVLWPARVEVQGKVFHGGQA